MADVRAFTSLSRAQDMRVKHVAIDEELRPSNRPAGAGWLAVRAALLALAAAVGLAVTLTGDALLGRETGRPEFLADKLGSSSPASRHVTDAGDRVLLQRSGYELVARAGRVAISSEDESGEAWRRYEQGAARPTPFGEETVVVDGNVVEQFLTVTERTGPKRWRWRLETGTLDPTLRSDGSVLVTAGNVVAGFRILPAAILDADGDDVTPAGPAGSSSGARAGGGSPSTSTTARCRSPM